MNLGCENDMVAASTGLFAKAEGDKGGQSAKPVGWHGRQRDRHSWPAGWWHCSHTVGGSQPAGAAAAFVHWVLCFCSPGFCFNNLAGSTSQVLATANPLCLWCGLFQISRTPVSGNSPAPRQLPVGGK